MYILHSLYVTNTEGCTELCAVQGKAQEMHQEFLRFDSWLTFAATL